MSYHEEIKILQDKVGLKICDLNALVSGLSNMVNNELNIATPDTSEVLCFKTSRSLAYFVASVERGLAGMLSDE